MQSIDLRGKSFITLRDYTREEIEFLLALAHNLKRKKADTEKSRIFQGKNLAMIFEKRSTRTRCAFETAFAEEGGHPVFLSTDDIHLGKKESIEDTARVLGRMFDAIEFRGYAQETVETLANWSGVPVYNGLTDLYHPTQALADIMTLQEAFGSTAKNISLCYIGDGRNNVAASLLLICTKLGISLSLLCPEELFPARDLVEECRNYAEGVESNLLITANREKALDGACAVYTDVWTSMGEEDKEEKRKAILKDFQVTQSLLEKTGREDTIFLHCLPAVKGQEVTEEVFEGPQSRVFQEAENRKHTIKAIMAATLTENPLST